MGKDILNDPSKYCDEWFEVAENLPGKEFILPNLLSSLFDYFFDNYPSDKKINSQQESVADPKRASDASSSSNTRSKVSSSGREYTVQVRLKEQDQSDSSIEVRDSIKIIQERKTEMDKTYPLNIQSEKESIFAENTTENDIHGSAHTRDSTSASHWCYLCGQSFLSGNALGGHMSTHSKKRMREAKYDGGMILKMNGDNPNDKEDDDDDDGSGDSILDMTAKMIKKEPE